MLKRTITAVVAIAIFIPVCVFSKYLIVWQGAMTVLSVMAAYEMTKCVGASKHVSLLIPAYAVSLLAPMLVLHVSDLFLWVFALYVGYMIWTFAADVFSRGKIDFEVSAASFMGVFYTSSAFMCLTLLRGFGSYRYLLVFIGPWVSDTFAYLTGRAIGRHKLIPEVSPKKTVEGAVGGVVFAAFAYALYGWIVLRFFPAEARQVMSGNKVSLLVMALAGAVVAVISQIGDLAMSVVKRRYGVKDYGWIFPGHGGVLDRFDSVLMTAPVLMVLSQIPAVSAYLV
ncbi:MAG: phosphatidate cytidylyltransferase [Ruminococcaceae bacterium]|jgi:phosphatidate cytidylyltransferase|nr:phosphatidate cytidylyltransferase [Oscillospiraceae bacterium]